VKTKRGTSNPTYLYYTLGKLEIMKLREDYKKDAGQRLHAAGVFTDRFYARKARRPSKIVRQALLGNDSPVAVEKTASRGARLN